MSQAATSEVGAAEQGCFRGARFGGHPFTEGTSLDKEDETDDYFGVCPECKKNDGYLNVGRGHWFICHEHKVRWCVGSNLFSSWKFETEDDWRKNWERIREYREIDPRETRK